MARRRRRRTSWLAAAMLLLAAVALAWWFGAWPAAREREYDRDDWPHWIDEDGDCQDTRQEVLVAESTIPVRFADARHCKVASGRWLCPYTGRVFTDPHDLDVDHLIPLHEAHRSGGDGWSREQRRRYANALDDADHLIAVAKEANRSKSDKGPAQWLPESHAFRCRYVEAWMRIKRDWGLATSATELDAVTKVLETCSQTRTRARSAA